MAPNNELKIGWKSRCGQAQAVGNDWIEGTVTTGLRGEDEQRYRLRLQRTGNTYRGELTPQGTGKSETGTGKALPGNARFGSDVIRVAFPSRTIELWPISKSTWQLWEDPANTQNEKAALLRASRPASAPAKAPYSEAASNGLRQFLGPEMAQQVISQTLAMSSVVESTGVAYKSMPEQQPLDQLTAALVDAAQAIKSIVQVETKAKKDRAGKLEQLRAARRGVEYLLKQIDEGIDTEQARNFWPMSR